MKQPIYHAGQEVTISAELLETNRYGKYAVAMVVYPATDGNYLLKTLPDHTLVYAGEEDIIAAQHRLLPIASENINVAFLGNGSFAASILERLHHSGYNLLAVTSADLPKRGGGAEPTAVKRTAQSLGIPTHQCLKWPSINVYKRIRKHHPHIIMVADFKIVPPHICRLAGVASINIHNSLLPAYRGSSAINAAIRNAEAYAGVTAIEMTEQVDQGNVICNLAFPLDERETAQTLAEKMERHAPDVAVEAISRSLLGYFPIEQKHLHTYATQSSYAPKISKKDVIIDWNNTADSVERFIRSLSPKPCARYEGKLIKAKILEAVATDIDTHGRPAGELRIDGRRLLVSAADRYIEITKLCPDNRRPMSGKDYINGIKIKV